MAYPEQIDFKRVIADLVDAGIKPYKIALMMHRRIDKILRWSRGQEPKHYEGQMLLMIHAACVTTENRPPVPQKQENDA